MLDAALFVWGKPSIKWNTSPVGVSNTGWILWKAPMDLLSSGSNSCARKNMWGELPTINLRSMSRNYSKELCTQNAPKGSALSSKKYLSNDVEQKERNIFFSFHELNQHQEENKQNRKWSQPQKEREHFESQEGHGKHSVDLVGLSELQFRQNQIQS